MFEDLTLEAARDALRDLEQRIGSKAYISASLMRAIDRSKYLLHASIYPYDILGNVTLRAVGDTWRELVANCEAKWAEHGDLHAANTTRKMALAIIAITADRGECTDVALRAEFDAADIARYGEAACAQATEMASNGPFSIVKLAGANDAEAA